MTKTLCMLGLSGMLMTGAAVGAFAATTDATVSGNTSTTVTTPSYAPNGPGAAVAPNGQTTMKSGGSAFVTGDGRVGPAAPSAGGKVGGGTDNGTGGGSSGGAAR